MSTIRATRSPRTRLTSSAAARCVRERERARARAREGEREGEREGGKVGKREVDRQTETGRQGRAVTYTHTYEEEDTCHRQRQAGRDEQ